MQLDLSTIDPSLPIEAGFARYLALKGVTIAPTPPAPQPMSSFQITITGSHDLVRRAMDTLFPDYGLTGDEPSS